MRTLIHISDLHFGKIESKKIDPLLSAFKKIRPDLIIISGDLTQHAKIDQFKEACHFLDNIEAAGFTYFVIPGNHDISPFYRPLERFSNPYRQYKKYISKNLEPFYLDSELAIVSLNTVQHHNIKDGRIHTDQLKKLEARLTRFPKEITRILVTHHPLDLPPDRSRIKLARRSKGTISRLSKHIIDLYLSGHLHLSSVVTTQQRYMISDYCAIAVQAGTISERVREEGASFNVIKIKRPTIKIDTYVYKADTFNYLASKKFSQEKNMWRVCNTTSI